MRNLLIAAITALLSLAGCDSSTSMSGEAAPVGATPKDASQHEMAGEHIAWFDGSVDAAFAAAKASNKPLFLYWGAEWCPPCHELKARVFSKPEFIRQSQLFVPVYLDGDTPNAQQQGEKFRVMGYPTVILFAPSGQELMRIPGSVDVDRYVSVLETALNRLQPVGELVTKVENAEAISDSDWQLLAAYEWMQDNGSVLGEKTGHVTLLMLAEQCPERLTTEKNLLTLQAFFGWPNDAIDSEVRQRFMATVQQLLADQSQFYAAMPYALYSGSSTLQYLPQTEAERNAILEGYDARYRALIDDADQDLLTRIDGIYSWVELHLSQEDQDALDAAQQQWVGQQIATLLPQLNQYQKHSGYYAAASAAINAGLVEEARKLLLDGTEFSQQPYYFMSVLGRLELEQGNSDDGLEWHRKAWNASKGPATRLQWGTNYLNELLDNSPDDSATIADAGAAVIAEFAEQSDAYHQRNRVRLVRLDENLTSWVAAADISLEARQQRGNAVAKLYEALQPLCDSVSIEEAQTDCRKLFRKRG